MKKERIESIRRIMLPFIAEKLKEIDYEGMGEFDAKEFTKDFNEILNLAEEALQQEPCDKCVYSTNEGCQYDDITETIPPFETSDDAISRQKVNILVDELARAISYERCCMPRGRSTGAIMQDILDLPPVTPQQKMGKWVKTPKAVMGDGYMWYCDNCEYEVYQDSSRPYPSEKYCPNCGCKMHEVGE